MIVSAAMIALGGSWRSKTYTAPLGSESGIAPIEDSATGGTEDADRGGTTLLGAAGGGADWDDDMECMIVLASVDDENVAAYGLNPTCA